MYVFTQPVRNKRQIIDFRSERVIRTTLFLIKDFDL